MKNNTTGDPSAGSVGASDDALVRSVVYRFLACLFRSPSVAKGEEWDRLLRGTEESLVHLEAEGSLEAFREVAARLREAEAETLERDYVAVFGHTPRGRCPPYETEYEAGRGAVSKPRELSDLAGFYRAFGLKPSRERPDHLFVECEFMQFLTLKENRALDAGDEELASVSRSAQRKFLRDHLGQWAPAFATRLSRSSPGVYGALGLLVTAFLQLECERFGIEPGDDHLPLLLLEETPEECLSCDLSPVPPNAAPR